METLYRLDKEEGVTVLTLTLDNVTMHENEELQKAFIGILDKGEKDIVLDLSRTHFISSVVLASLVFMLKKTKETGGNIVLCGVKDRVEEALAMSNLDKVFDIFENRKKAVGQFAKK